jgi:hypothetical protein
MPFIGLHLSMYAFFPYNLVWVDKDMKFVLERNQKWN